MKLRVNEAIARSEANGKKVLKKDIAARLFEGASESARQVNMTNLCNGTTKRIVRMGSNNLRNVRLFRRLSVWNGGLKP